jgi:hydroxymethylpyrimidine pyrophosphatase-like HAD family hydrolase
MKDLAEWRPSSIIGVFTDIDDTLTTEGAITPDALQALADLKAAGLHVVPITGRPVGWSESRFYFLLLFILDFSNRNRIYLFH